MCVCGVVFNCSLFTLFDAEVTCFVISELDLDHVINRINVSEFSGKNIQFYTE